MRAKLKPCIVCGNVTKGELSRHHLLPKDVRDRGTRQITVKLCKDQLGCKVHHRFHQGDKKAAVSIRKNLLHDDYLWMIGQVGETWVRTIYPSR